MRNGLFQANNNDNKTEQNFETNTNNLHKQ
jgi:hypothetical protein